MQFSFNVNFLNVMKLHFSTKGLSTGLAPLYNSEVAPVSMRGAIGVLNQLAVTVGISISQILGLTEILGDEYYWPLLLGIKFVSFLQSFTVSIDSLEVTCKFLK